MSEKGEFENRLRKVGRDQVHGRANRDEIIGEVRKILQDVKVRCPLSRSTFDRDFARNPYYWKDEAMRWFREVFGK